MCTTAKPDFPESVHLKTGGAGRKRLWQLENSWHCSVIGTCLSSVELRSLCARMAVTVQTPVSSYELHRSFVAIAGKRTRAARRLQKYLDRKYRGTIRRFARALSEPALEALWNEAVESGDLRAAYWALMTHPLASPALCDRVYGAVHMLSHQVLENRDTAVRGEHQELGRLRHAAAALTRQLADARSNSSAQVTARDKTIRQLRERLAQAQAATRKLRETQENAPPVLRLRCQVEDYAAQLAVERLRAERAEADAGEWRAMAVQQGDRHVRLERQLAEIEAERDALEAALDERLSPDCGPGDGCGSNHCEQNDCSMDANLRGRCILYVGGIDRQCGRFRKLVERQNGRFIHHDGGLHGGRQRLGSILPQADAVFCPLDCVSHDAVKRVKQFCKRHGKRLVMLPRASLAAFTRGLNEVAA